MEKSSTSSTMPRSISPLERTASAYSRCCAVSPASSSSRVIPTMPLSGVRISWLTLSGTRCAGVRFRAPGRARGPSPPRRAAAVTSRNDHPTVELAMLVRHRPGRSFQPLLVRKSRATDDKADVVDRIATHRVCQRPLFGRCRWGANGRQDVELFRKLAKVGLREVDAQYQGGGGIPVGELRVAVADDDSVRHRVEDRLHEMRLAAQLLGALGDLALQPLVDFAQLSAAARWSAMMVSRRRKVRSLRTKAKPTVTIAITPPTRSPPSPFRSAHLSQRLPIARWQEHWTCQRERVERR